MKDFDLGQVAMLGFDMFPVLNELREAEPIHWNERTQCWVVSRHQDIVDALNGTVPLSNRRLSAASLNAIPMEEWPKRLPNMVKYAPFHITNMDPPNHTRLRKLMVKAFGRGIAEALRPFARERAVQLIESMRGRDRVDFPVEIARELSGSVLLKLLQFPQSLVPDLMRWAHDVMVGLGTPNPKAEWVEAADRAFVELTEQALIEIADRRAQPRGPDDFITALVTAREGHDGLTDDEVVALMETVLIAGQDTSTNSMTLGAAALAQQPWIWAWMKANPDRMLDAVLEIMRYTAMSTAQNRAVGEDFEWHGKNLKKGDVVFLMFAAGNRDPRVFPDPEKFDPLREQDAQLTFGPGIHHCIGHLIAKMQLTEFFTVLTQQFNGAEILDSEIKFSPILVFRSIPSLHMRFS